MPPAVTDEPRIQERGHALIARIEPTHLVSLSPEWWQERMLSWATADPAFRVRLLQFVDVLPALRTPAAVADHVRQYFRGAGPGIVEAGAGLASRRLLRPVLSKAVRESVHAMASRFIAGATPDEALPRLRELVKDGAAFTVDLLGEATLSDAEAETYTARYLELIRVLTTEASSWDAPDDIRRPNISLKLSAFTARFEPAAPDASTAALRSRVQRVLEAARAHGVSVNVDMEQYRYRDLVHHAAADLLSAGDLAQWPDAGIVVQAYLRDAVDDIARLEALARARGTPITVRLVKGAYWDEETIVAEQEGHAVPVFVDKAATDANYERCTARLLAAYPHLRPAFATHHPRTVAQAMVRAEDAGLPPRHVEFQVLYGMAEGLRKAITSFGYRTRVYVPCGEIIPGMAYLVRRLLENTSNESWLIHRHEQPDASVLERPVAPGRGDVPDARPFRNFPHAEFHKAADRRSMEQAIASERGRFGAEWPAIIDGRPVEGAAWDEIHPPAHPQLLMGRVTRSTAAMGGQAVTAAAAAFPAWRDTPPSERATILRRAAGLLAERRFELAAVMVYESAKPWGEAFGDVTEAIDFLNCYSLQADELSGGIDLSLVPAEHNRLIHEGRGVAAIIAPWNFPLAIITGMTAGALAGGCTAVMKPAEQSPIIAAHLHRALLEAGVPPGVVHYLPGPGEDAGNALVRDPRVAMIAFTGSNAVGLAIMEAAARTAPGQPRIKRVIAELGGKNAIIVDGDADLDQAVEGVITSAFAFAGQKCSACSRVIVLEEAYAPFRERLAAAVESLPAGPPEDPYTCVPPVISADARERILAYAAIGEREGRLVARGRTPEGGHYVAPAVFEDIPLGSKLTQDEVFGPVLAMYRARDFEAALSIALDSRFALTGGVYSRNPRNIAMAMERFRVGNLYINRPITGSMVGRQPFAGFGMSGTGEKAGGPDYVRQFTLARVVTENTMRRGFAPDGRSEGMGSTAG